MAARKPKLTPWFDAQTQPVYEGQYEVMAGQDRFMAIFAEGKWWEVEDDDIRGEEVLGVEQWRGLASKPRPRPAKEERPTEPVKEPESEAALEEAAGEQATGEEEPGEEILPEATGEDEPPARAGMGEGILLPEEGYGEDYGEERP